MSLAYRTLPVVLLVLTCVTEVAGDTTLTFTVFNNYKFSLTISRNIARSWVDCLNSNTFCDLSVESTNDTNSYRGRYISPGTMTSNGSFGLQQNVSFCQWDPNISIRLSCNLPTPSLYKTYSTNANRCTFLQFTNEKNYTNYITVLWNHDCTVDSTDSDFIRFSDCGTSKTRQLSTTTEVTLLTTSSPTAVTLLTPSSTTGVNNVGLIAGCVAGGVVVLIIIILVSVLVCFFKKRRQRTLEKSVRQDGAYTEVDLTVGSAYTEIDLSLGSPKAQDHTKLPSAFTGSLQEYQNIIVACDNNRDEDSGVKKSVENLDKNIM